MFFTGKLPWWYGNQWQGDAVGINLGENAVTAADAIRAAELDWIVRKTPAAYLELGPEIGPADWIQVPNEYFLLRDKDNAVLGRCTGKYVPFQNVDGFNFLDSLVRDGAMLYHTAGSMQGGKKVWILAQLPGKFEIGRLSGATNTHYPFLLVVLGHDGASGINLMATNIRAECANTVGFAEGRAEREKLHWSIAHTATAEAKLRLAASALAEIPRAMVAEQELLQELARDRMTQDEFIDFATGIFLDIDVTDPAEVERLLAKWYEDATPRSKTIMENKVAEVTKLFYEGQGAEGNTAYDAVQAFTEHFDHAEIKEKVRGKLAQAKRIARMQNIVHSSWMGAGARRKGLVMKRLAAWRTR
jgi:phage/plasmid-like protein (TIGR03299 family)